MAILRSRVVSYFMKEQETKQRFRTQIEAAEGGNDQGTWNMFLLSFWIKEKKKREEWVNRRRSVKRLRHGDTSPSRRRGKEVEAKQWIQTENHRADGWKPSRAMSTVRKIKIQNTNWSDRVMNRIEHDTLNRITDRAWMIGTNDWHVRFWYHWA